MGLQLQLRLVIKGAIWLLMVVSVMSIKIISVPVILNVHNDKVPDLDLLQCTSSVTGRNLSFSSMTTNDFVCQYTSSCFPVCNCYYNDREDFMNCSSRSMTSLPYSGPTHARNITLDNNNLTSLSSTSLNFPHLERLSAYNSHVSEIEPGTFSNLIMLRVLDLHQNDIETIGIDTFANLSKLEELYLNGNIIHNIENGTFNDLIKLKTLWLHGNKLKSLDFSLFTSPLTELTLHDNPWFCGCEFGPQFKKWVIHSEVILNEKLICCNDIITLDQTNLVHNIASYSAQSDTPMDDTSQHYQLLVDSDFTHCIDRQLMGTVRSVKSITEVVSLAAVFAILVIFILTIYKTRLLLRVWFYNKCGVRVREEEEDNDDKPYDLFIAYAKADERLVVRELLPELERADMSYKVCLECRDWPAATTTDMVIASVQQSKRTIVLVSPNHLDTQWCEYSFDAAHYQVLTDKQIRLILVLTDIGLQSRMTRAMKLYMKTNTFLMIGEKWFWKKLRYYLADNPRGADHVVERDFDLLEVY